MSELVSTLAGLALKGGIALMLANEVRGLILAAPVLYGMYLAGGTMMGLWIGICSLAGILRLPLTTSCRGRRDPISPVHRALWLRCHIPGGEGPLLAYSLRARAQRRHCPGRPSDLHRLLAIRPASPREHGRLNASTRAQAFLKAPTTIGSSRRSSRAP